MTAAVAAALSPFALDQENQVSSELSASFGFVVALCFAIPGGRAFPADSTAAVAAALSHLLWAKTVQLHQRTLRHRILS